MKETAMHVPRALAGRGLTLPQVAAILGVSRQWVNVLVRKGVPCDGRRVRLRARRPRAHGRVCGLWLVRPEDLAAFQDAVRKAVPPATPLDPDVAAFVAYLRAERGVAYNTVEAYAADVRRFAVWAADGGLVDYLQPTADELGGYTRHLSGAGLAPSSVARHQASVKLFYRFLRLEGRAAGLAAEALEAPAQWERLPHVLSVGDVGRLLDAPRPTDRFFLRDRALLETLYATGARASEAVDLTLRALDLDAGECRLLGKGRKERLALLSPVAIDALRAYLAGGRMAPAEAPWVFVSRAGRQLTRALIFLLLRRYGRRAGLHRAACHPHVLRHSFASHLLEGGADIRFVQEFLGHASINTTQRYTHTDMRRLRSVHRARHPRG
jgi:integrase/recombinase XerD